MKVLVLISTIDDRIKAVPKVLLPEENGVGYVIVWQKTDDGHCSLDNVLCTMERGDVRVIEMEGKGLCRSRNRAVTAALESLSDSLEDAVFVIADDDEQLMPEAFQRIRTVYEQDPKLDSALFRLRSSSDGTYFKDYPDKEVIYGFHPRSYYPCSWEMTFRSRVWQTELRFDERFGLGAEFLCAGEEDVLLTDMQCKGFCIKIIPEDIGYTEPITTGSRQLDDCVLRSKGAVYGYRLSLAAAFFRSLREACSLAVKNGVGPLQLFCHIWSGVRYIRS